MKIDPMASFYLTIVYKGEIALKKADLSILHEWAETSLNDIYKVYNLAQDSAAVSNIPSISETVSDAMRIFPGNPNKAPKKQKIKKNYSMEFIELITKTLGGKINEKKDGFDLPKTEPGFENALNAIKHLMKRAYSIQMVPKGMWLIGSIISVLLFLLSFTLLFYRRFLTEYFLLGAFFFITIYCFSKWKNYPNFPEVAEYIKGLVYKGTVFVDDEEK